MATVDDLRVVLRELESDTHDCEAILATVMMGRRRRAGRPRWAVPALAAAVVATLVVGPVAYFGRDRNAGRHAVQPADLSGADLLDRYVVTVGAVPAGLTVADLGVTTSSQTSALVNADGTHLAEIVVDRAGSISEPEPPPAATRVTINGNLGYNWTSPTYDAVTRRPDGTIETFAWTTGSGLVLSVEGLSAPKGTSGRPAPPLTHDQLRQIAGSLSLGSTRPVRTPLAVRYLPPNYHVEAIATTPTTPGQTETMVDLVYGSGVNVSLQIMLGTGIPAVPPSDGLIRVGPFTGTYSPTAVATVLSDGRRSIEVYYNAGESGGSGSGTNLPLAVVTRIVQGLQVASAIADASTWFDAVNAVPH